MKKTRKRPVENTDLSRLSAKATRDIIGMFKDRLQWVSGQLKTQYQAAIHDLEKHERSLQA